MKEGLITEITVTDGLNVRHLKGKIKGDAMGMCGKRERKSCKDILFDPFFYTQICSICTLLFVNYVSIRVVEIITVLI